MPYNERLDRQTVLRYSYSKSVSLTNLTPSSKAHAGCPKTLSPTVFTISLAS